MVRYWVAYQNQRTARAVPVILQGKLFMKTILIDSDCPALKRLISFYVREVMSESMRGNIHAFCVWLSKHLGVVRINLFYVGSGQKRYGYQIFVNNESDWTRVLIEHGPFSEFEPLEEELSYVPNGQMR